jgi:proline iminopeptidase
VIVQGRYGRRLPDPPAWDLHRAWPEAEWSSSPDAGHSMTEPGIRAELIARTHLFAAL